MNARLVSRGETAFLRAQDDCWHAVRELVPPPSCGGLVLERLVRCPVGAGFSFRVEAAERGIPANSITSAWHRAGCGSIRAYRAALVCYLLRRVIDVEGLTLGDAALVLGASAPTMLHRLVAVATGTTAGVWVAASVGTAPRLLEDWRALLTAHAPALRTVRFPTLVCTRVGRRAERAAILARRLERLEAHAAAMRAEIERLTALEVAA